MQDLNQPDIILHARGILRAKEDRCTARFSRQGDIVGGATLENQLGETLEPAVPLFDVQHRLTEGFVISDGHMNRINTAFAQLAKDLSDQLAYCNPSIR